MSGRAVLSLLALLALVAGCGRDRDSNNLIVGTGEGSAKRGAPMATMAAPPSAPMLYDESETSTSPASLAVVASAHAAPAGTPRRLVRNASLQLVVADVDSASAAAQRLAVGFGGFVATVESARPAGAPSAQLTLRVPVARLDEALAALRAMARRVEHERQAVEDVTDQIVDVDARLRTLRATETELRALLAQSRARGHKLEDVMTVYRELAAFRTQIEQLEGRRESLEQLAALSTIQVQITPEPVALPVAGTGWRPGETLHGSLTTLLATLRVLADVAIYLLVFVAPLCALIGVPFLYALRILRRRRVVSRPAVG